MAWQDRPYYRDRGAPAGNPLLWLLYGSVPLFTIFGIRVRAHASLVLYVGLVLLLGLGRDFAWQDRVLSMSMLFLLVLLHEFGHCFAARWLGGSADNILMHPLGGLAMAQPPRHPWPTFLTVAAGPAVNLLICIITGTILWISAGWLPWDPFHFIAPRWGFHHWYDLWRFDFWIYEMSLMLLAFNLLPIFPLDGGQMVQTMLWPKLGYYRSMLFSCIVGMVAAVLAAMVALATPGHNIGLALLALMGFLCCFSLRRQLLAIGPEEYADETDYSAAYEHPVPVKRRRKISRRAINKARRRARQQAIEQRRIDTILAKVSAQGIASLTWTERRALKKATERQRKRDLELTL